MTGRIVLAAVLVPTILLILALVIARGLAGQGWEGLFLVCLAAAIGALAWARNRWPEL